MLFELCVESLEPCLFARAAGAARLELCRDLRQDGLSPTPELVRAAVAESGLPVHVMVRPRPGNFVYGAAELAAMADEVDRGLQAGVTGFVLGVLTPGGAVDVDATAALVRQAAGREVTFHRAFDVVVDQAQGLEAVIASGCRRVLTSGGAPDVFRGGAQIARLVRQATDRVAIAVGGGLRVENAAEVARHTGAQQFHGTARRAGAREVTAKDVRLLVSELLEAGAGPER